LWLTERVGLELELQALRRAPSPPRLRLRAPPLRPVRLVRLDKATHMDETPVDRSAYIDLGEHGKIVLVEAHGRCSDLEDLELMGQRIANFLGTPFVDTSRW
jgi:hypothetical protein